MLSYNPCTGQFSKGGKQVGHRRKDGYVLISEGKGIQRLAHRLAWKTIYGVWPTEVDHIDGDPSNNSIWNLREVSHQDNCLNTEFHRAGNKPKRKRPGAWKRFRSVVHLRS